MKPLLPTLKEGKRYMVYDTGNEVAGEDIRNALSDTIGLFETAASGLQVLTHDNSRGILRTTHNQTDTVRTALMLTEHINDTPVQPRVVAVSGTLNNAKAHMEDETCNQHNTK